MVLTTAVAHFCKPGALSTTLWSIPLLELYSVEAKEGAGQDRQIELWHDAAKPSAKQPIAVRPLTTSTRSQRDLWLIVLRRVWRDAWQCHFESRFPRSLSHTTHTHTHTH